MHDLSTIIGDETKKKNPFIISFLIILIKIRVKLLTILRNLSKIIEGERHQFII